MERQAIEQEQARLRRQAAKQEYDNERREMLADRENILSRLAAGKPGDAAAIAREGQKVLLKKSSARRSEEDRMRQKQAALRGVEARRASGQQPTTADAEGEASSLIKGLKRIKPPEPEKPYDPFGGFNPDKRDYYILQDYYPSTWLDPIRDDVRMQAGGYDLEEYYSRTLLETFAGLGCFIEDEVSNRNNTTLSVSKSSAKHHPVEAAVTHSQGIGT